MSYEQAVRKIEEARVCESTELDLSNMGLSVLPPEICKLTALTGLDLRNNQLTDLPESIGQLTERGVPVYM